MRLCRAVCRGGVAAEEESKSFDGFESERRQWRGDGVICGEVVCIFADGGLMKV